RWCSGRWSSWWILVVVRRQGRADAVGCDRRTAEIRQVSRPAWASQARTECLTARRGVRTAVVTKNSSPVKDEVVTSARPVMLTLGEGRHGCALCGYGSHEAS